jgi:type I restriction enzyme S subunit
MKSKEIISSPYGLRVVNRNVVKLSELCSDKDGIQTGPFGSQLHNSDYVAEGTPIITVEHLGENVIDAINPPRVHADDVARLSKYTLQTGDIVFSRVGSVDRRALVSAKENGWMFSGRLLRIRPNLEKVDAHYLSYFFGLTTFKSYIRSIAVGATMPSLNTDLLANIPIIVPALNEQRMIGKMLACIDTKIQINQRLSKTLEDIAQSIFKSWFIDFDPVKAKMAGEKPVGMDDATAALFTDLMEESELGPIPRGWHVGAVGEICSVLVNGSTPSRSNSTFWNVSEVSWFKTGELSDGFLLESKEAISESALTGSSVKILPKGSVLMAIYAAPTVGRLGVLTHDSTFNQACTGMLARKEYGMPFLFLHLKNRRNWFNSFAIGAAQQNISKSIVENCPVVIGSEDIHEAFLAIAGPLFEEIECLTRQSAELANLRDSLLPRLISGDLKIPEEMLVS